MSVMHVDSKQYRSASKTLNTASKDADKAADALKTTLAGCGSMAGGTADCLKWAADYDKGASVVFEAVSQLSDLMTSFSIGCLVSAMNHEAADAASAGKAYHHGHVPAMPAELAMCMAGPPSAAGGDGQTPQNWGVIQKVQDIAWPDGDVDKLRAAAGAWSAAATAIDGLVKQAQNSAKEVKLIASAESASVDKKFTALEKHLREVASGCRTLSKGCTEYADHIKAVHDDVKDILKELALSVGVTVVAGVVFGAISAGAGSVAAGCVTAAEAGAAASRIVVIIARVATFATRIGGAVSKAGEALAVTGRAGALTVRSVKFSATLAKYTLADSVINTSVDAIEHGGRPINLRNDVVAAAITSPFGPLGALAGQTAIRGLKAGTNSLAAGRREALKRLPPSLKTWLKTSRADTTTKIYKYSGALSWRIPKDHANAYIWAEEWYERIRVTDDVSVITDGLRSYTRSDGSKFTEDQVQAIKHHVFEAEHKLTDVETGRIYHARYDAEPNMAAAWLRLSRGEGTETDRLLLEHEYAEHLYMETHPGCTYSEAHAHANTMYNWEQKIFG